MRIGDVIRKYRKEKQMTQEEMANYLGVTAPAVNKWENHNSLPDISMLAPIARLLEISTDTLLSYQEDLTDQEIGRLLEEINGKMRTEEYDSVFCWAMDKLREYPNCDRLSLQVAQLLEGYGMFLLTEEKRGAYEEKIEALYKRSVNSADSSISQTAIVALVNSLTVKEAYSEAQEYLERLPQKQFTKEKMQANLYRRQGMDEEAYKIYESSAYSDCMGLSWALQGLYSLARKENDMGKAQRMRERLKKLTKLMEFGDSMEASLGLENAFSNQDKEAALDYLETFLSGIQQMGNLRKSELYSHMKFSDESAGNLIFMLKKSLENDQEIEFLKDDERYTQLMKKLEKIT